MSPNDKAVIIADYFAENGYQRAVLMTAICHGLTVEEIDKLYNEVYKHQENTEEPS